MTTLNVNLNGMKNGAWIAVHGRVNVEWNGDVDGLQHHHKLNITVQGVDMPKTVDKVAPLLSLTSGFWAHGNINFVTTGSKVENHKLVIDVALQLKPAGTAVKGFEVFCMVPL